MDYEKKIREYMVSSKVDQLYKSMLNNLFPELKESEDGRIINNIKKVIGWYRGMFTEKSLMPEEYQEINAWLEKQGEQKPAEYKEDVNCRTTGYWVVSSVEERQDNSEIEPLEPWSDDKIINYIITLLRNNNINNKESKGINESIEIWLKSLKGKVQPKQGWSEEDNRRLNKIEIILRHSISSSSEDISWLKSLRPQKQQQEDEWSDEDKEFLELTLSNLAELKDRYGEGYGKVGKCIDWLKSLQPQPIDVEAAIAYQDGYQKALVEFSQKHQEWTDDDINMIDWLIRCCEKEHEELCNDKYGHQDIVSDLKRDCRKKLDWLESLKDKAVPQEQWKPSKEQMDALNYVVNLMASSERPTENDLYYNILKSLRQQLKKLKA